MSDEPMREMTLDEYCDKLLPSHLVHRQLAALKADIDKLQKALDAVTCGMDIDGNRQSINAGEDPFVLELCERHGFGAVMDSASRQWRNKDPIGAFLTGPCVGTATAHKDVIAQVLGQRIIPCANCHTERAKNDMRYCKECGEFSCCWAGDECPCCSPL